MSASLWQRSAQTSMFMLLMTVWGSQARLSLTVWCRRFQHAVSSVCVGVINNCICVSFVGAICVWSRCVPRGGDWATKREVPLLKGKPWTCCATLSIVGLGEVGTESRGGGRVRGECEIEISKLTPYSWNLPCIQELSRDGGAGVGNIQIQFLNERNIPNGHFQIS